MLLRTRPLSVVTAGMLAVCATRAVAAQPAPHGKQADAPSLPAPGRLTVVQDQPSFSIISATPEKPVPAVPSRVPLGARLALDRALFGNSADDSKEASDAPRR